MSRVKWCGFAHHFICASRCQFHLATFVDSWMVSSVGAFYQKPDDEKMTPMGGSPHLYETLVFPTDGDFGGIEGHPSVTDWCEVFGRRTMTEHECNDLHQRVVDAFVSGDGLASIEEDV
jgi:hypothetical protein